VEEGNNMRRCDTYEIINALIRRRHNDAIRIRRLKSRLNDDKDTTILQIIRKLRDKLIDLGHNPDKSHIMKAIDRFRKSVIEFSNGSNDKKSVIDNLRTLSGCGDFIKNKETKVVYNKALTALDRETYKMIIGDR
jgi:hypothetical protein